MMNRGPSAVRGKGAGTGDTSGVHVWLVLWKAWKALETYDRRSIEALGMCPTDFAVLEVLLHKGPQRVNDLGRRISLTSGSITTAVDRLVKRKMVRRAGSAKDARVRMVELTSAGRTFIARGFELHAAVMERAASVLGTDERAALLTLLRKLGKSVAGRLGGTES